MKTDTRFSPARDRTGRRLSRVQYFGQGELLSGLEDALVPSDMFPFYLGKIFFQTTGEGMMKQRKGRTLQQRGKARQTRRGRVEVNRRIIQPDSLMKEVEEANAHIANPDERERIIPSRPC